MSTFHSLVSFVALRLPLQAAAPCWLQNTCAHCCLPADLSHTGVTSHSKCWTCCHASLWGHSFTTSYIGLLLWIVHLSVWELWLSCTLFLYRWIARVYASLWPALRCTKTMIPTQIWWAISSGFHHEEAWLPFLACVCHEKDHSSPAFATGLGPNWFLLQSISIYLDWGEVLVCVKN